MLSAVKPLSLSVGLGLFVATVTATKTQNTLLSDTVKDLGLLPTWEVTYSAAESTIFMPCNYSGIFNATFASNFGVADWDWSNMKQLWVNPPGGGTMTCEESLLQQAQEVYKANPKAKSFIYRNGVKALPWFSGVREKIQDPQYSGWFLKFSGNNDYHVPTCDNDYNPPRCSIFYHDQDQTPHHPTGDGSCIGPCDCGEGVPCGEYLWNHANGTMLRDWLINEHFLGPTGLGDPSVLGFYVDDGWANTSQPIAPWMPKEGFCDHSDIGGATEEDLHCSADMGLTQEQTTLITDNWKITMQQLAVAIQAKGAFAWYMFSDSTAPSPSTCATYFRNEIKNGNPLMSQAVLYQWTNSSSYPLPYIEVDVVSFMLVRGDYAWLGYAWLGCTSDSTPGHGSARYTAPSEIPQLQVDYGTPNGPMKETGTGTGIFVRDWTKATVQMDCNSFTPSITMK